jgi:hypothetical protein
MTSSKPFSQRTSKPMAARRGLCVGSCVVKLQSARVCRTSAGRPLPCVDQWRLPTCSAHFSTFPLVKGRTLGPQCPSRWMTNHTHFDGQKNSELHQAAREDRIDDVRHPRPPAARARGSEDDILACPRALRSTLYAPTRKTPAMCR